MSASSLNPHIVICRKPAQKIFIGSGRVNAPQTVLFPADSTAAAADYSAGLMLNIRMAKI